MAISIGALISGIFKPAADLIDSLHTSEEEKMKQRAVQLQVQLETAMAFLDYEAQIQKDKAAIVLAEVQGGGIKSWWRPITMLTFLALAVLDALGVVKWASGSQLAPEAWTLLQLGLGGYVVGRSGEKIAGALRNGNGANS